MTTATTKTEPTCPACQPQPHRTACRESELCGGCFGHFKAWAGKRWHDPVARRAAFTLWIRLKREGCLR